MAPVVFTSPILCRFKTDSGPLFCTKTASSLRFSIKRICSYIYTSCCALYNKKFCLLSSLMTLWESGLPKFWVNGVTPRHECLAKTKPRRFSQTNHRRLLVPIKLNDLMGAFLILGIGTGLATFVFLAEKIIHFRRQRMSIITV